MPSSGREYVRLYADLAAHPKWGRLPLLLRGAWASLLVYAATRNDPTFTHEQAVWLLKRDGDKQAAAHIDALVDAGWLDRDGDALSLHDWHDHQPVYRGPSDSPEAKAARNALRPTTRVGRSGASGSEQEGGGATEERRGDERRGPFRASAHEEPTPTPPPVWKPTDVKHLNSKTDTIRDTTRRSAEAAEIDWRALLTAKGEEPNE